MTDSTRGERAEPDLIQSGGEAPDEPKDRNDYEDPAVDLPGDDDYVVPMADVGDAQRGQGADHVGGYGYEPIAEEPGPSQDH